MNHMLDASDIAEMIRSCYSIIEFCHFTPKLKLECSFLNISKKLLGLRCFSQFYGLGYHNNNSIELIQMLICICCYLTLYIWHSTFDSSEQNPNSRKSNSFACFLHRRSTRRQMQIRIFDFRFFLIINFVFFFFVFSLGFMYHLVV